MRASTCENSQAPSFARYCPSVCPAALDGSSAFRAASGAVGALVAGAFALLAPARAPVLLITKGDLLDQERKLAQSGLGEMFDGVEIVSDKVPAVYTRIFAPFGGAAHGMMIGNSMKSDVRPMIDAGGIGVHVPHDLQWDIEAADAPDGHPRFHAIPDLGALSALLG